MKKTMLTLKLNDDIESFFEHSKLYAVFSSLPVFTLCNRLNTFLGLNFKRDRSEDNFDATVSIRKSQSTQSLFDATDGLPPIFPIFKHAAAGSKVQKIIYSNKFEGHRLLSQYSTADYFLLIRNFHLSLFAEKGVEIITKIEGISAINFIDIAQLKQKSNLIVQEPESDSYF